MRDDNMEPRDNQQMADDSRQSGVADRGDVADQITNTGAEDDLDDDADEDDDELSDDDDDASAD